MTAPRHTPRRSFRIPDDLYHAAQEKARERGDDLATVVRAALTRYINSKRKGQS